MFLYLILEKTFWRFSHEILSMFGISIYNRYDAKNRITNRLNVSFFLLSFLVHFRISFGIGLKNCSFCEVYKGITQFFDKIFMTDIFDTIFMIWNLYCILSKISIRNIILEFLWFQNGWRWRLISLGLKFIGESFWANFDGVLEWCSFFVPINTFGHFPIFHWTLFPIESFWFFLLIWWIISDSIPTKDCVHASGTKDCAHAGTDRIGSWQPLSQKS